MSPQENNDNTLSNSNIPFNNNSNPHINPITGRPVSSAVSPSLPNPLPTQNTEKPTISRDSELVLKNNSVVAPVNANTTLTTPISQIDNLANLDQPSLTKPTANNQPASSEPTNISTNSTYSPIFTEPEINTSTTSISSPTPTQNSEIENKSTPNLSSSHLNNYGAMHTIQNTSKPSTTPNSLNSTESLNTSGSLQSSSLNLSEPINLVQQYNSPTTESEFTNKVISNSLPDPVSNPLPSTNTSSLSDSLPNQIPVPTLNTSNTFTPQPSPLPSSQSTLNPQIDLHNSLQPINNGIVPPTQIPPSTISTSIPNNKSHRHNKLLKISLIVAVVFFIFAILISLSLIPFGNQAFASKVLDAIGAHKLALGVDSLTYGATFKGLAGLAELNSESPEKCGNAWDKLSQTQVDLKNFSSKQTSTINPVNDQYADAIDLKAYLYTAFDLENGKAAMDVSIDGSSNTNKIKSLLTSLSPDYQNLGLVSFSALLKGVITTDNASFALDTLKLASTLKSDLNLDGSLPDWYQQKFNLNAKQKQNIILILTDLRDIINVKLSNLISAETGKSILVLSCKIFDKVDIQAPKLQEFGYGSYKVKEFVRPIAINLKSNYMDTLSTDGKIVLQNVFKDETLKNYLKSKYDTFNDISKQISELIGSNNAYMSKDAFNKDIDDSFANASKSLDSSSSTTPSTSSGVETTTAATLFLSMQDGSLFGTKTNQTVKYSQTELDKINDAALKDLLKDGIVINTDSYAQNLNSSSFAIKEPTTSKSIEDFGKDFNKTTMGKRIFDVIGQYYSALNNATKSPTTLSSARNTQRTSDVMSIGDAISRYILDGGKVTDFGAVPLCTTATSPIGTGIGNINLEHALVYDYLVEVPKDPTFGSANDTGYTICKTSTDHITISAPHAEDGKIISVTR